MKELTCKNCGATLKVRGDERFVECPYCGTTYAIDDLLPPAESEQVRPSSSSGVRAALIVSGAMVLLGIIGMMPVLFMARQRMAGNGGLTGALARANRIPPLTVCEAEFTGDGTKDYIIEGLGSIALIDGAKGKVVGTLKGITAKTTSVSCLPHGLMLAQNKDGTYSVLAISRSNGKYRVLRTKLDPPGRLDQFASGPGCIALRCSGEKGSEVYLSPSEDKLDRCDHGPWRWTGVRRHGQLDLVVDNRLLFHDTLFTFRHKRRGLIVMEAWQATVHPSEEPKHRGRRRRRRFIPRHAEPALLIPDNVRVRDYRKGKRLYTTRLRYEGLRDLPEIGVWGEGDTLYLVLNRLHADDKVTHTLVALSVKDGKIVWTRNLPTPSRHDLLTYFGIDAGRAVVFFNSSACAVELRTRRLVWSY